MTRSPTDAGAGRGRLAAAAARARGGDPGTLTAAGRFLVRWILGPSSRLLFRRRVEGLDNVPRAGSFMLVANHSGGMGIAEIASLAAAWLERFGSGRPLAGFAHPFAFHLWPLSSMMRAVGAIPSTYEAGEAALAAGVGLLIFPGGDHEVSRPIWQAKVVDFAGRVGFIKLARKAGVPIVPVGINGAHFTAPVLWRSEWLLARLFVLPWVLGLRRYPLTLLAVLGALALALIEPLGPWRWPLAAAWVASPLTALPWVPWRVRIRVGEPMPAAVAANEPLEAALERVEAAVRALANG